MIESPLQSMKAAFREAFIVQAPTGVVATDTTCGIV